MNSLQLEQALESIDLDVYFSILEEIIHADNILHEEQMVFLRDQAEALDYDLEKLVKDPKILKDVDWDNASTVTKNIIIRDCIVMAYSNGDYHEDEEIAIRKIARDIGLNDNKIAEIESWLNDYWSVLKRAESVLFQ